MIRSVSCSKWNTVVHNIMYIKKKQIKEKIISIHFQITKKILRATESNPEAYSNACKSRKGKRSRGKKEKKKIITR